MKDSLSSLLTPPLRRGAMARRAGPDDRTNRHSADDRRPRAGPRPADARGASSSSRARRRHRLGDILAAAFKADNPDAAPDKIETERSRFAHAPLVVAVVSSVKPSPKIPEWEQVLSAGAVCMNLLHAAKALGYGAVWLSGWSSFDRRVLDALGLAPHERIAGYIHIGTSTETPDRTPAPGAGRDRERVLGGGRVLRKRVQGSLRRHSGAAKRSPGTIATNIPKRGVVGPRHTGKPARLGFGLAQARPE